MGNKDLFTNMILAKVKTGVVIGTLALSPVLQAVSGPLSLPVTAPVVENMDSVSKELVYKKVSERLARILDLENKVTESLTGPLTKPVTLAITGPITLPITLPITNPITLALTSPITLPITLPITSPLTLPITLPITAPVTEPITNPITGPVVPTTAIPTIIPTATPTPVLVSNTAPIILTKKLNKGKVGSWYKTDFVAVDKDGDYMDVKVSGLAPGLKMIGCNSQKGYVRCYISGRPLKSGIYKVKFVVKDSAGGVTKKTYRQIILPDRWFKLRPAPAKPKPVYVRPRVIKTSLARLIEGLYSKGKVQ